MPQGLKEGGHQAAAFLMQKPHGPGSFGMQKRTVKGVAPLGVRGSGNNSPYLAPKQGPSAHHAGFKGHIEGAFVEVFGAELVGGGGDRLHFSMSRGVVELLTTVVTPSDDFAFVDNDRPDRNFTHAIGLPRQAQGLFHVIFVTFGTEHFQR